MSLPSKHSIQAVRGEVLLVLVMAGGGWRRMVEGCRRVVAVG